VSNDAVIQFLDSVAESGLVSQTDLETVRNDVMNEVGTERELADELVSRDLLTAYQAQQVLAGLGRECILAQRYRILDELGKGAMGVVYRAFDTRMDRQVAIKVLPAHRLNDADAIARFRREAKAQAQLSHTNIVQAFDFGQDQDRHFLAMELVEGTNLADLIRDKGRITPALAADFVYQAALGLHHAHEKGLVHRDLKPSNLVLAQRQQQIKVLDLGLARFLQDQIADETLTREGIGMGTPDYMAPEQFRDARSVDARSDIYSLGCTLYHMIAGHVPFPGSSFLEKCKAHEEKEPASLEDSCLDVPAGLVMVVERMMAKRPDDRFQTAREVAEALAPHVAGSSLALPDIRATASWQGSVLAISVSPRRRIRKTVITIGVVSATTMVLLAAFLIPKIFVSGESSSDAEQGKDGFVQVRPVQPSDPNVLTVAQDGTGQFRTISEALDNAKPGLTIRVLDDAIYTERITISHPSQHAGITLESPRGATIASAGARFAVEVNAVPNLTLRGFRIRAQDGTLILLMLTGRSPGLVVDGLDFEGSGIQAVCISFEFFPFSTDYAPAVVINCQFHNAVVGVQIRGWEPNTQMVAPTGRIMIRNNYFMDTNQGIVLNGSVRDVGIVANRFSGCGLYGIQLMHLLKGSGNILVANNTFFECLSAFRVWEESLDQQEIRVCNNLILASTGPDMMMVDSGGSITTPQAIGDFKELYKRWQFHNNWRETSKPPGNHPFDGYWLPPAENDEMRPIIDVMSRESDDVDFLRPPADSPLADQGAGNTIRWLPKYVGVVAPAGVDPWDWQTAWSALSQTADRKTEESDQPSVEATQP